MKPAVDHAGPSDLGAVFSAAKDEFGRWAPLLWDPMGEALAELAAPATDQYVLDACCGSGSSALPAARAVGTGGRVDAIDVAEGLLDSGRARAAAAGLKNVRFKRVDATRWQGGPYDVVQCAYGVFMLPNMDAGGRHLMSLLKPSGRFAVTVWERGSLEDFGRTLYDVAGRHKPALDSAPPGAGAIGRIDDPDLLRAWLSGLGLRSVSVRTVSGSVALDADRAWDLVLGSGFRQVLQGFSASQVADCRAEFLGLLQARKLTSVVTTSLLGVGVKP